MKKMLIFVICFGLIIVSVSCAHAFSFSEGHFYATRYDTHFITEYDSSGNIIDTLNLSSLDGDQYLRGLAFGPDGLLYATVGQMNNFKVLAINSSGNIQQTYMHTGAVGGNISYGKIDFDNNGHFYVGDGVGIIRFNTGGPLSGDRFSNVTSGVFDIKTLSNNNMLVVTDYNLLELDSSGNQVREILPSVTLGDNRGIEYDPNANVIYLSMLGYSNFYDRIIKLDGTSGQMLDNEYFNYADDLLLTDDGRLIAASRVQSPGIFNTNLGYLGSFGGGEQMFVTQYVIPEPATAATMLLSIFGLAFTRRVRGTRPTFQEKPLRPGSR